MGRLRAAGIAGYNLGASCQVKEGGHGSHGAGDKTQPLAEGRADLPLRVTNPVLCNVLAGTPWRALAQNGHSALRREHRCDFDTEAHTHKNTFPTQE